MPNDSDTLPDTLFLHRTPAELAGLRADPRFELRAEQGVLDLDVPVARVRVSREPFGVAVPEGGVAAEIDTAQLLYIAATRANSSMPFFAGPEDMKAFLAAVPSNDGLKAAIVERAHCPSGHTGPSHRSCAWSAEGDEGLAGLLWHLPFQRPSGGFDIGHSWSNYVTLFEPLSREPEYGEPEYGEPEDVESDGPEQEQASTEDAGWPDESMMPPLGEAWLIVAKDVYAGGRDRRRLAGGRRELHHEDFGLPPAALESAVDNGLGEAELRLLHSLGVPAHRTARFRPPGTGAPRRSQDVDRWTQQRWTSFAADFVDERAAGVRFGTRPFRRNEAVTLHLLLATGSSCAPEFQSVVVPDAFDRSQLAEARAACPDVRVSRLSDPPPKLATRTVRIV